MEGSWVARSKDDMQTPQHESKHTHARPGTTCCTEGRPKCARKMCSFWPGNCLMVHTMQSFSGAYFAVPFCALKEGESCAVHVAVIGGQR